MKKEILISFRVVKIKNDEGKIVYALEIPKDNGSVKNVFTYSTLEKLADGIYDFFDYDLL